MTAVPVTVAHGDGIGPEIMDATLHILKEAGAGLALERIEIGEGVYKRGFTSGIEPSAWESLRRTKVFLKSPITTPQGGGFKSLNVTVRKTLGLFANVRPCVAYSPFVQTKHPEMDLVIVRENEEDLYAGIEYRLSEQVYECLKLISEPGCERIVRFAFEYARRNNRRKVTCFSKDNIMKFTDGLFHRTYDRIAADYPDIENEHWIVDIGAARLADTPEMFDVIVMQNLYGDILSDVAAQIAGSVGLGGSSNIGEHCAMFEAIHGSAPKIAGQNIANPSGLLLASVMMLVHIGQPEAASRVHNAWLRTLEEGIHTPDIFRAGLSRQQVGTKEFAQAVVDRLGQSPRSFRPVSYAAAPEEEAPPVYYIPKNVPVTKELAGVDVYIYWPERKAESLAPAVKGCETDSLALTLITNRGIKVWPEGMSETFCSDSFRCRFMARNKEHPALDHSSLLELLAKIAAAKLDFVKTENLSTFDGQAGYSLGQGQ